MVIVKITIIPDISVMTDEQILKRLAQKVKEHRLNKGVTQEQAYNDTGIHIARIEQGKRDITYTTLVRLADYFGVGLGEFE